MPSVAYCQAFYENFFNSQKSPWLCGFSAFLIMIITNSEKSFFDFQKNFSQAVLYRHPTAKIGMIFDFTTFSKV